MRSSIITTSLDRNISYRDLIFKQFDTGHRITIRVVSNGKDFPLNEYTALAVFKFPEKPLEERNCVVSGNTVSFELDNYLLSVADTIPFEIKLYKEDVITTTFRMQYIVEESFDTNGAITSQPKWDVLQQFIDLDVTQFITHGELNQIIVGVQAVLESTDKNAGSVIFSDGQSLQMKYDSQQLGGNGGLSFPTFEVNIETGMLEVSNSENISFEINEDGYLEVLL